MRSVRNREGRPSRLRRRGILVAFSGVDGSGKSTQVDLLEKSFEQINVAVLRIRSRWRPVLSLPLLVIMRRLGYAKVHRAGGVYIVETRLPSGGGLTSLWCILTQMRFREVGSWRRFSGPSRPILARAGMRCDPARRLSQESNGSGRGAATGHQRRGGRFLAISVRA